MLTVLEIIKKTTDYFAVKGIESPRHDAELLIGHALSLKRMQLYLQFERMLTEPELEKIRPLVRRRSGREPLQHITGEVDWGGIKLKVDRRALIPRPETELLFEMVSEIVRQNDGAPKNILDLGTGTGALALALAHAHQNTRVTAADISDNALALARENASMLQLAAQVTFIKSDWFAAIPCDSGNTDTNAGDTAFFDVIVSNPPYLTPREVTEAAAEVRQFEPRNALVAENDGCAHLLRIIAEAPAYLSKGGLLAMETGINQHATLLAACTAAGYLRSESRKDLTGRDRFIFAQI